MKIVEREIKDTKGCDERRHVSCLTSPVVSRLTSHAPTPWPKVKLGEIADLDLGKMLDQKKNKGTPRHYLANIDVRWGYFNLGNLKEMLFKDSELERYGLRYGDIVMCEGGEPGRCAIWKEQRLGVMYQKALHRIRPHEGIDFRFLYYYFLLLGRKNGFAGLFTGSTIKHMPKDKLALVEIPLPPLPVQRRIADVLSAYDDLIENNRRRIAILEETARLAYRKWFVERHFPGHECVSIEDGIPHGWEKVHLGDCVVTNLQSYRATELPSQINYIDISSVKEGRVLEKKHLCSHEAPGRARRIARSGDVIWSNVRPNLKSYALILEPEADDVFSTGFTILTPKSIPYSFLYFFVSTDEFVSYLDNMVTGATYPAVRPGDFEQAELLLPNRELLTRFHTLFEPLLWQCEALVRQNAALTTARDMLLPRLMKGEVNL